MLSSSLFAWSFSLLYSSSSCVGWTPLDFFFLADEVFVLRLEDVSTFACSAADAFPVSPSPLTAFFKLTNNFEKPLFKFGFSSPWTSPSPSSSIPSPSLKSVSVSVSEPEPEASSLLSDPSSPKPIIDFTLLNVSFLGVCSSLSLFAFSSSEPESEAGSEPYSNSFAGWPFDCIV